MSGKVTGPELDEIYFAAMEQDPSNRAVYLDEACGTDVELRRKAERLLAAREQRGSFLDTPALGPSINLPDLGPLEASGTVIGPYRLLEPIGEGGMGIVYLAEQSEPVSRKVALKVIKPGMDTKHVIARFEAERQALAMMDHPNIARIFDGGMTPTGRPYFVMELVRGLPITEYCDRERLSIPERLELFVLVCRAVQHAHQKGIIHRDLKPSNIMVALHDGVSEPKVIDFGVAKAIGGSLTERSLHTAFQQFIGTPLYMSPEQINVSGVDVDTRSDVYSLGVLLYELLTGTTPFDVERLRMAGFDELLRIIREEEPPRPSTRLINLSGTLMASSAKRSSNSRHLNRSIRGELDWIVMKAMEKDPRRRYETVGDFAADVLNFLRDLPVHACPPSAGYRLRKLARRNRGVLATVGIFAITLAAGTGVSIWQAVLARHAARRAERSEADTRAFSDFLVEDVLSVARPEGVQGGLGVDVTVARALEEAEPNLETRFAGRPLAEATARDAIGKTWRNLVKFDRAERHLLRAAELRRLHLGPDHPETLDTLNSLGVLYAATGRYSEAIPMLEDIVRIHQAKPDPDNYSTLMSMFNLGEAYNQAQMHEKARPLLERTLERMKATLGPDDIDTFKCIIALSGVGIGEGRVDGALALLEPALERQRAIRPDHPETLIAMTNLATAYSDAGKIDQAIDLFRKTLERQKVVCGHDHPDTLDTMNNLAYTYRDAGRFQDAEPLFRAAVAGARLHYSPLHVKTRSYISALAHCCWRLGRYKEAVELFEESLANARQAVGDREEETLAMAYNLAVNYREDARLADAEKTIEEWWPRWRDTFGLDHESTRFGIRIMLAMHDRQKQPAKAEAFLRELAALAKEKKGADSPQYARLLVALGQPMFRQENYSGAEPLLREGLAILESMQGDDWTTSHARSVLGAALLGQKKYPEAEPFLVAGYEGMKRLENKMPFSDRIHVFTAKMWVVRLYNAWGRKEKADEWRKK